MRDQWYRSPQTNVRPVATAALFRLLKQSREAKRMVWKHCALTILQFFHSPFFSIKLPFLGWTRAINDIAAHRPMFAPFYTAARLRLLKQSGKAKRMVKKHRALTILQFLHSLFSIKLPLFGRMRDQWYHSPQTDVCPVATAALFRLLKQSGEAKRMVRKLHALTILMFLHSPIFQLNCLFWSKAWSMISQPTYRFLPRTHCCPLEFIKTKKNGEKRSRVFNFSVL